ncbi:unnamed protein product [Clonostachys byssicola]|uniref:Intradiol ring-cleavage dioxygenases domain-containing protein n=1 Tax=Clonostachys byssicola TaxID=160290 RepID=A0A9N9Y2V4_9HYPO|nr:unnamed protein product [Clonostachys byssicola]
MRFQNLAVALLVSGISAHPGHDVKAEALERREALSKVGKRSLSHCFKRWEESGLSARNHERRSALVEAAREKLRKKRSLDDVLNKSHDMTSKGYTTDTPADTLFSGINSCVLTPEVTQGPYYVSGEDIRVNIVESQAGLDTILDYQVIDVDTCDPVPDVYLEMWHCNSTGVYSGVNAQGNGNSADTSNIYNTWLRGIQETDSDGVAQFESIFPGHYTSRATHIHIMVHTGATRYDNGTLGNNIKASHVGQAFFDQSLITKVELLSPYSTNRQQLTTNAADSILAEETRTDGVDPVMEFTLLGDDVSDGLFAWIAFGIDTSRSQDIEPAVFRYKEGPVTNPNSGGGGGGGGGGGPPS